MPDSCCEGITRRTLITGAVAAGALASLGGLPGLGTTSLAFADTPYAGDTVVVLSLRGGFDGLSAVVPAFDPGYAAARPSTGVPANVLVPLDGRFGLHPALAPLAPLWRSGQLAAVHAVGQSAPTRSHFAAMDELERAAPGTSLRTGWLDRTLGVTGAGGPFAGTQVGQTMASPGFLGPYPEMTLDSVDGFSLQAAWNAAEESRWLTAMTAMQADAPPLVAGPARTALSALTTADTLRATPYVPAGGTQYPEGDLGAALRDVARLVKAGVGLRVAAVDSGDWDMHVGLGRFDDQYGWMRRKLDELGRALAAFTADLGPAMSGVTVVTLSEFGRRVAENGSGGVDHGHGNAVLLLGGGVVGGQVYGRWPGLDAASLVDGDLAGTTDYRTVLAEVLEKRCGLTTGTVFPGLDAARLGALRTR
jgi:uncharacterized protein (DUF1501 family)